MTAQEAIEYINNYTWSAWKLGLDRTRDLLAGLGNPQKKLKFVHVAGTNGKGSTCSMTASILTAAGYKTGLYPSPYIEDFRERIQIDGHMISPEALADVTSRVAAVADAMDDHPSQFELITAIGMVYFAESNCDIVVLEVGMGGEFDSTNAIDAPEVAVICNIGLDHTQYLGDTVEKIAATKCGIIKPGCSVVSYDNVPSVMDVIRERAKACEAKLYLAADEDPSYPISLLGPFQKRNEQTVLAIVRALRDRGFVISEDALKKGLISAAWPARFEKLSDKPLFFLDGGHNPQCAKALAECIEDTLGDTKVTFLIGMLADKDVREVVATLSGYAASWVCITPDSPRAMAASELALICAKYAPTTAVDTVREGILSAIDFGRPVVAFGSLYSAGEIRKTYRSLREGGVL